MYILAQLPCASVLFSSAGCQCSHKQAYVKSAWDGAWDGGISSRCLLLLPSSLALSVTISPKETKV